MRQNAAAKRAQAQASENWITFFCWASALSIGLTLTILAAAIYIR